MSFNNNAPDDLSRFSIGEIAELAGVPTFYDAGSSKWLKSGQLTASTNLTTATKANLSAAGTVAAPTVIGQSSLSFAYNVYGMYANFPVERIAASSVSVVPSYYVGSTAVGVGVATSAGLQAVPTGQTSIRTASSTEGSNAVVAGNGTTIFSYTFTSATALSAYYTTNGTTWTAGSVTGLPTFAADASTISVGSRISGSTWTVSGHAGFLRRADSPTLAVFWCGARFVLIAPAAVNYMVSLSTDGLAWGGDNTTAVIGATAQVRTENIQFYRNGNSCYLNVGSSYRFTTDGGITWAASTFTTQAAPSPSSYYMQYNQTDPAKLVIWTTGGYNGRFTSDSGATWSANRPFPSDNVAGGLAYKGSTLVASNGSNTTNVSTNDGVSWTASTLPIGTLANRTFLNCDANRFYLGITDNAQLLTSSDGVTWTIVTLTQNYTIVSQAGFVGPGLISFDSNTVAIIGYSEQTGAGLFFSTLDGGVTWTAGQFTSAGTGGMWQGGNVFLTPDGGGVAFQMGASLVAANGPKVLKADLVAGGAFYRTGLNPITPIRANAAAYVRVG